MLRRPQSPSFPRCHPRGFTLVEILLVVVIIGVMAGLATLAVGSKAPRQLQQEAERLHQRLRLAQDEALFNQKNLGVLLSDSGYRLLQYDEKDDRWLPLQTDLNSSGGVLRDGGRYEFTIPVVVSLALTGAPLQLSRKDASQLDLSDRFNSDNNESLQPELVLLANGEMSPFTLTLQRQQDERSRQVLHSDGFSPITRSTNAPQSRAVQP